MTLQHIYDEEQKKFEVFYLSNIVDNGDGCSVLPKEDFKSFLLQSNSRITKAIVELIKKEIGEDAKVSDAPVENGRNYPNTQAIKIRAVQQGTNFERSRLRSFLQDLIK